MAKKFEIDESKTQDFSKRTNQLISLTTLVLAICATFSSLYAGAYSSKAILAQSQASDNWAYYQAKSLKETFYKMKIEELEIDPPPYADAIKLTVLKQTYQQTADRYEEEQMEIRKKANLKEAERDHFLELNSGFAGAMTYLQIAILMVSLSGLMKQIHLWYASMAIGAFGVFKFAQAMLML